MFFCHILFAMQFMNTVSLDFFSSAIASRREIFSDLNPDLAAPSVHHRIPFWCLRGIWCARAEDFGFWNISLLLKRGGICHVLYWDISLIGLPPLWLKKFLWKTNWKKTSWKIIANMHCCAPTLPSSAVFLFFFLQTSCCYSDTQPAEAAEGKLRLCLMWQPFRSWKQII